MQVRAALAVLLAALVAAAPGLAMPAFAAAAPASPDAAAAAPTDAATVAPKVVIVVGATESTTSTYRTMADSIAAEALKWTPNVVKVYSPYATWSAVAAAANGASIFVYLGHGYGFPNPYTTTLNPTTQDGLALNTQLGLGDTDKQYYGEASVQTLRLAPNAIVFLNHLCYAPGAGEPGAPEPTLAVAEQRVDNFASGFIRAGARTVMADDDTGVVEASIRGIFTTHQPFLNVWRSLSSANGHEIPFAPYRNPAFRAIVDPVQWTSGYMRSVVADPALTTDDVVGGAGLAASNPTGPTLTSMTGATTVSPNFDESEDRLDLWARLSRPASWTWTLAAPDGTVVQTQTGSSDIFGLGWDGLSNGAPAAAGTYHWSLTATDGGGGTLDTGGDVTVVTQPVPTNAVLSFTSLSGVLTHDATVAFEIVFAAPVSGFVNTDLSRSATAGGCITGSPTGGPTDWIVTVSSCGEGTLQMTLKANSVVDGSGATGPPVAVASPIVTIDRTKPTVSQPKASLKAQVTMGLSMPVVVTWSGSDYGGSGLASYDLAKSVNGGSFTVIASGLTTPTFTTSVASGKTYRYEVRAHDGAGNVGGWYAGPTMATNLVDQAATSVTWAGTWATASSTAYSGGSERRSSTPGSTVTYTFTGRSIAIVASRDPAYGQVKVYIDGTYIVTTETAAAAHLDKAVVFSRAVSLGTHTVQLVVVGTAGRPTVAIDAFEVVD